MRWRSDGLRLTGSDILFVLLQLAEPASISISDFIGEARFQIRKKNYWVRETSIDIYLVKDKNRISKNLY